MAIEKKYVEASAIVEAIRKRAAYPLMQPYDQGLHIGRLDAAAMLESAPAEDVAPVRHGMWVDNVIVAPNAEEWRETEREIFTPDYKDGYKCNLCGAKTAEIQYRSAPTAAHGWTVKASNKPVRKQSLSRYLDVPTPFR